MSLKKIKSSSWWLNFLQWPLISLSMHLINVQTWITGMRPCPNTRQACYSGPASTWFQLCCCSTLSHAERLLSSVSSLLCRQLLVWALETGFNASNFFYYFTFIVCCRCQGDSTPHLWSFSFLNFSFVVYSLDPCVLPFKFYCWNLASQTCSVVYFFSCVVPFPKPLAIFILSVTQQARGLKVVSQP